MEIRDTNEKHKREIEELRIRLANLQADTDTFKRDNKMVNEESERMKQ
jgi:hypothetical protein